MHRYSADNFLVIAMSLSLGGPVPCHEYRGTIFNEKETLEEVLWHFVKDYANSKSFIRVTNEKTVRIPGTEFADVFMEFLKKKNPALEQDHHASFWLVTHPKEVIIEGSQGLSMVSGRVTFSEMITEMMKEVIKCQNEFWKYGN